MGLNNFQSASTSTQVEFLGTESFRMVKFLLSPGEEIISEPGSMASQESQVNLETQMNGNVIQALLLKFLGKESFFATKIQNLDTQKKRSIYLSQSTPGDILEKDLNNKYLFIQPGSLIAREKTVTVELVWAGFSSFLLGEGLFRIRLGGVGKVWYGCYGAVIEKEIDGELLIDTGFLLSYPENMSLSVTFAGGLLRSLISREGLVLKMKGRGKIQLQTRSIEGLSDWLNARFWR